MRYLPSAFNEFPTKRQLCHKPRVSLMRTRLETGYPIHKRPHTPVKRIMLSRANFSPVLLQYIAALPAITSSKETDGNSVVVASVSAQLNLT